MNFIGTGKIVARLRNYYYERQRRFLIKKYAIEEALCKWTGSAHGGVILMFHHITDGSAAFPDDYSCSKDVLDRIITHLQENKYAICSLDDAVSHTVFGASGLAAVITFDDGSADFYDNALPRLQRDMVPFTLYLSPGFIGRPGYLSLEQVQEIAQLPYCTIGAHTLSHPQLRLASDSWREIKESGKELDAALHRKIRHFAYPFGSPLAIAARNIREASQAGYDSAVYAVPGFLNSISVKRRWKLPRMSEQYFWHEFKLSRTCEVMTAVVPDKPVETLAVTQNRRG